MEFVCPVCKAIGNISDENLTHPLTKTSCQKCSTILLINPEKGNVAAHKAPIKDSLRSESSNTHPTDAYSSILSMRPQETNSRDWSAIVVVSVVLVVLISAGIIFTINMDVIQEALLSGGR